MFDPRVGLSGTANRMVLLPVLLHSMWRLAAVLENFEWPYLGNGSSDQLHLWFKGRVFDVGRSDGATSGWTKSKITAVSRCTILNGHISETVHPILFVFGSRVKVQEKIIRLVTI